jgi:hypothetical protein
MAMQESPIDESQSLPVSHGAPLPPRFTQTLFLQVLPLKQGTMVLQAEPSGTGVTQLLVVETESYWHLCGLVHAPASPHMDGGLVAHLPQTLLVLENPASGCVLVSQRPPEH